MDEHEMQELIHLLKSDPVGSLGVLGCSLAMMQMLN
jgi:hypothetical protein